MASDSRPGPPGDLQAPFVRPAGATEVLLVRHGSSEHRRNSSTDHPELLDGQADPPLSSAGVAQAKAVARRLSRGVVDHLFVTSLQRTWQTAEPLAEALGLEPRVVPDLREVALGDLEGDEFERRRRLGDPLLGRAYRAQRWDVIPGAEPMGLFAERVRRGLKYVVDTAGPDAAAVAVVHGGVIAEICHLVTGSDRFAFVDVENGSFTRLLRTREGTWRLRGFNETAHLEDMHGELRIQAPDPAAGVL